MPLKQERNEHTALQVFAQVVVLTVCEEGGGGACNEPLSRSSTDVSTNLNSVAELSDFNFPLSACWDGKSVVAHI